MSKPPKPTGTPTRSDETRKVSELTPDPHNARRHSEGQVSQIVASMERFGVVERVLIRPNNQIIGGHARLDALKRMGRVTVDVSVIGGLSEAGYKALGLALNRIPENSRWDDDVLRDVFAELDADGEDAIGLGFSSAELQRLLSPPDELEVKEIETGPVDDEFWISVRGPLAQQANALKALQEAMKPFAGVEVEQGTINIG